MTQTKFEIQKRKGLKIDAGVRRGPQGGKQVGAQGKRNAAGSKLLGALLGVPSDTKDATGTTPGETKTQDASQS